MIDNLKNNIKNSDELQSFDIKNVSNQNIKVNKTETSNAYKFNENNSAEHHRVVAKKSITISQQILNFVVAVVSVLSFGFLGTGIIFSSKPTVKAEIVELEVMENAVFYYIEIFDGTEEIDYERKEFSRYDDIFVVVYNDFTNRSNQIYDMYYQGYEENLKPNMTYTIEVRQGSSVLTKRIFKTIATYEDENDYYDENYDDYNEDDYNEDDYNEDDYNEDDYNEDDYNEDDNQNELPIVNDLGEVEDSNNNNDGSNDYNNYDGRTSNNDNENYTTGDNDYSQNSGNDESGVNSIDDIINDQSAFENINNSQTGG